MEEQDTLKVEDVAVRALISVLLRHRQNKSQLSVINFCGVVLVLPCLAVCSFELELVATPKDDPPLNFIHAHMWFLKIHVGLRNHERPG